MEIGKPKRVFTVEPAESPVPALRPTEPARAPAKRRPVPVEQPARQT